MRYKSLIKAFLTRKTPVYVHYGITHRCNLRCRACQLWKETGRELSLREIAQLADNLGKLGVSALSLGGGEPALRADLPQVFSLFKEKGLTVRILTNGIDLKQKTWETLFSNGLKHISLSLDSLVPEVFADLCRHEGALAKVLESLEFFSFYLKKAKGMGIINTVVSSRNLAELPELVNLGEKFGFYLSFIPLEVQIFGGKELGCREGMADLLLKPQDLKKAEAVYGELIGMKKKGSKIFNSTAFLKLCRGGVEVPALRGWQCLAGRLYFSINPEGSFSLCHRFKGYKEKPEEIPAFSPDFPGLFKRADYYRGVDSLVKSCPGCLRPCWAEVALSFTSLKSAWESLKVSQLF